MREPLKPKLVTMTAEEVTSLIDGIDELRQENDEKWGSLFCKLAIGAEHALILVEVGTTK